MLPPCRGGKGAGDPLQITAGNFSRTVPMALLLSLMLLSRASPDSAGVYYALLSGALTSGVGYAIWYSALPLLKATTAATVQLSVPLLAALGGVVLLQEPLTLRLLLAALAMLGGIALVLLQPKRLTIDYSGCKKIPAEAGICYAKRFS